MIVRNAARCPLCGDTIESKRRHDFRSCMCGALSVDGGLSYIKRCWDDTRLVNGWDELAEYDDREPS